MEFETLIASANAHRLIGCEATEQRSQEAITKAAALSNAPFLRDRVSLAELRAIWGQLYGALIRLASLERALTAAKMDLADESDFADFYGLKAERDSLRRDLGAGEICCSGHALEGAEAGRLSRH